MNFYVEKNRYNSKSCCTVQQSQNIQSSFNSVGTQVGNVTIPEWVKDIFLPCLDQLNLFVCFPCDGSQTNYLKYNIIMQRQEFTVCQTFCDRMYDKCRLVPIDSQGNLIGTKYKDGSSMCLGEFGPRIKDWTMLVDTQNCFNSSPQTATLSFRLIALLVICSSAALFLFL